MRVLYFNNLYPPNSVGGAERAVAAAAEALVAEGHDVTVVTTDGRLGLRRRSADPESLQGVSVLRISSANVYHFTRRPASRLWRPLWFILDALNPIMAFYARRTARQLRPDVVVVSNYWNLSSSIYGALTRRNPVIAVVHDGSLLCLTGFLSHHGEVCHGDRWPCRLFLPLRRWQTRAVSLAVAPSHFMLSLHKRAGLFASAAGILLPNRVDTSSGGPAPLRDSDEPLRIAYVGQLATHKGLDVLRQLASSLPSNAELTIVGAGQAEGLDARGVRQLGETDAQGVREALRHSHVLILPSMCEENAPLVLLEAEAEGVAVVAFAVGGVPEMLEGRLGALLVQRGDITAFMTVLRRLASDPELTRRMQLAQRSEVRPEGPSLGQQLQAFISARHLSSGESGSAAKKL